MELFIREYPDEHQLRSTIANGSPGRSNAAIVVGAGGAEKGGGSNQPVLSLRKSRNAASSGGSTCWNQHT